MFKCTSDWSTAAGTGVNAHNTIRVRCCLQQCHLIHLTGNIIDNAQLSHYWWRRRQRQQQRRRRQQQQRKKIKAVKNKGVRQWPIDHHHHHDAYTDSCGPLRRLSAMSTFLRVLPHLSSTSWGSLADLLYPCPPGMPRTSSPVRTRTMTSLRCNDLFQCLVCWCGGVQSNDMTQWFATLNA